MLGGGVSYLITVAKLMQNKGHIHSVLHDFLDHSIEVASLFLLILTLYRLEVQQLLEVHIMSLYVTFIQNYLLSPSPTTSLESIAF